jgi:zinc/manganese transport system substrate-binding protein
MLVISALSSPAYASGMNIMATFMPIYIFAKNVTGDRAQVSLLVPSGTDVHEFSMRPLDVKKLAGADIILLNGAGLESNLARMIDTGKAVDTSKGIELIKGNPHIWLDPVLAAVQVENIRDALSTLDPENRNYYRRNADAYIGRLKALDREIGGELLKVKVKYLITFHEAFNYFARRYGLVVHSLTGPNAENPLPGRIRDVYDIVKGKGVKAVFTEEQFPSKALERLKKDLGVRLCTLNTLESGKPSPYYYEETMRNNLREIINCLGDR